jgi:general L-amino acid transport system permease protein
MDNSQTTLSEHPPTPKVVPFWRDERILRLLGQLIFLALLAALFYYLFGNMFANLRRQGLGLGFDFLDTTAGFDIGEKAIPYARSDTYLRAFTVGLINTGLVSLLGIFFATLLGIVFGVGELSGNFLVRSLARGYIELLRNIPLLVLLIFLYSAVFIQLPRVREAIILPGPVYLSNRGVAIPWGQPTQTFSAFVTALALGLALAALVMFALRQYGRRTGRTPLTVFWGLLALIVIGMIGWLTLPAAPLNLSIPAQQGLRLAGGLQLSPEFMALLSGLSIYTSAFIADVVRAGIQSVGRGQVEAARSLGFNGAQTLRLVVFPQALRVIIPPLTSQYLNLAKNSSLAVAIGYPELFHVSGTVLNQSGRAVEVITIVMAIYLAISLLTSALMNLYNRRVRLVER